MTLSSLVKQDVISLKLFTSLGVDTLVPRQFKAVEEMDEPFEVVCIAVSENRQIEFKEIVGQEATLQIDFVGGSLGDTLGDSRYFHGVVGNFRQYATSNPALEGIAHYELRLYPRFWLLKLVSNCRVFQNESPNDIIKKVLNESGITDLEIKCQTSGQTPREYCVQYNETTFDFVSRLMEEEGIFYCFRHEMGKHTMILLDNPNTCTSCVGAETIKYEPSRSTYAWLNLVTKCDPKQQMVSKEYTQMDYNMTMASTELKSNVRAEEVTQTKKGERFYYPGVFDDEDIPKKDLLETLTRIRLEEVESLQWAIEGYSTSPYFVPGTRFNLTQHHRSDLNKSYILRKVVHQGYTHLQDAEEGDLYRNEFEAFDSTLSYRPRQDTPKPKIYSAQTATVTGPEGEEIWTDKYGRIKIQFHWDRLGLKNETSSCWVRVMQGWGGNDWGVLFTPRIGMEAMITFLDGNPDRPIVTGCYYNSDHMPPYLPERVTDKMIPTMSTIKSNSSKGGNGFNELRFNDLKAEEQVYFRAEKDDDSYIKENQTKHVEKGSVWESIDRGDVDIALYGDNGAVKKEFPRGQDHPVGAGDFNLEVTRGNRNTSFLSTHGAMHDSYRMKEGDQYELIDKGSVNRIQKEGENFREITKGSKHQVLGEGDHSVILQNGNKKVVIHKGDRTFEDKEGNDIEHLHHGSQLRLIDRGDKRIYIKEGFHALKIDQGNHCCTIETGIHSTHIYEGDKLITINVGGLTIMIGEGDKVEEVNGVYQGSYTLDYTLTVGGAVEIVAGADVSIVAGGGIELVAGADISMVAGGAITATAGGVVNITAGAACSIEAAAAINASAGAAIAMEAGGAVNVAAGGAISQEAGGVINLSAGGIITQEAAGACNVTAVGAVMLEAGGICNITSVGAVTIEAAIVISIPPPVPIPI